MIYTIKYECEPPSSVWDDMIMLRIKYRPQGRLKWTCVSRKLWSFAKQIYGIEYSFYHNTDFYSKIMCFQKIIDERYGGSLERYVEDIVRHDVIEKKAEQSDMKASAKILMRFVTKGWHTYTAEIEDNA